MTDAPETNPAPPAVKRAYRVRFISIASGIPHSDVSLWGLDRHGRLWAMGGRSCEWRQVRMPEETS